MLFRWIPVPGTTTPEPEPVEAVQEAALPSASTTEICVVAAPIALDRVRELLVAVQPARQPSTVQIAPETRAAHAVLLAHDLDQPGDRLRASRRAARAEPVDHPQAVADQDAAGRGGRVRLELVPAEDGADGAAPDDAVLLEIAQRDRAAVLADVGGDRARQLAPVDRARAVLGELLQGVREVALDEPLARDQTPPSGPNTARPSAVWRRMRSTTA